MPCSSRQFTEGTVCPMTTILGKQESITLKLQIFTWMNICGLLLVGILRVLIFAVSSEKVFIKIQEKVQQ